MSSSRPLLWLHRPALSPSPQSPSDYWIRAPTSLLRPVTSCITWSWPLPRPHLLSRLRTVLPPALVPQTHKQQAPLGAFAHAVPAATMLFLQISCGGPSSDVPSSQRPTVVILGKAAPDSHHSLLYVPMSLPSGHGILLAYC